MEDLSLHILDIAENCIRAGATRIEISINENIKDDKLVIQIKDNGRGMDREIIRKVQDPFFTTKTGKRWGLGIPLLNHAARQSGGNIKIRSRPGVGTTLTATFAHSHIDRQPLGNIEETLHTLLISNPNIEFIFKHKKGRKVTAKRWEAK